MATTANRYVLVVDDDLATREGLRDLLEGAGYTVRTASNGSFAIGTLKGMVNRRVVVLLDLVMPDADGFYFIRRASLPGRSLAQTRIVVLSGDAQAAARALLLEVSEVLRKPIQPSDILDVVARQFSDMAARSAPPP